MCLKMGIIGTGRIVQRFIPEARTVDGIEIVCIYNPRLSSAKTCAETHKIQAYTDDIEIFLEQVDAVYIASPHETHVDYCRQMLAAGKHVLCEKPLSFSQKGAEELYVMAEKRNLVLMEGMKTAYCPGFQGLLEVVKSGTIGEVVDVEACFSRISPLNVREMKDKTYGGSFTEFGSYTLLPIVKLLGTKDLSSNTWALKNETGIDIYTKTNIVYEHAIGLAKTGLGAKSEGQLVVAGTKGYILVPSPWWLTTYFEVRYEDSSKIEKHIYPFEGQGLRYEISEFVNRIDSSKQISFSAEESIWFAKKMEEYLKNKR